MGDLLRGSPGFVCAGSMESVLDEALADIGGSPLSAPYVVPVRDGR